MEKYFSRTLSYFRTRLKALDSDGESNVEYGVLKGGRNWEKFYRGRWGHDKIAPSTHGNNCSGSCRWHVYSKDGIIVWEVQGKEFPTPHPDFPDYEPRGCPRGASASWYVYSPLRVRYPYIRSQLLSFWREAKKIHGDPVVAWEKLVADREKRGIWQKARGLGGFERVSWEEAIELTCASMIHTIKKYGPDRVFGFTASPAMSMLSHASGTRLFSLMGVPMITFYDYSADLPQSAPQVWGIATDVPVSADWYNASYIIDWGSNLPQTRTADAHFFTETVYQGTKIVAVSPDYADFAMFADTWLPIKSGTDGALAMAMTHVVLKEFYLDRKTPYFESYSKQFTDLPYLLMLEEKNGSWQPGRFLRASDFGMQGAYPEWKFVVYDKNRGGVASPNGSMGTRYGDEGKWNLDMQDCHDGKTLDPVLSFSELEGTEWLLADFPLFAYNETPGVRKGAVPVIYMDLNGEKKAVTTVFDIFAASLGIDRGHGGDVAKDYDDASAFYTPAWQETVTGVDKAAAIRVAREFAENAEKTRGRSLNIIGAGLNHWYNNDTTYRPIMNLGSLCGCHGVNGGGWAHYVGQEKLRPSGGWSVLNWASDWMGPIRPCQGTTFFYWATDSWRYELIDIEKMSPGFSRGVIPPHPADCSVIAARLGWMPHYPQFRQNSLDICQQAEASGAKNDEEIVKYVVDGLKDKKINLSIENPDDEENVPRVLFCWRVNPLGSFVKGHEYMLRYMLGATNSCLAEPSSRKVTEFEPGEPMEQGKLDLLVSADFRMTTSCLYSDVVLPSAHWYEYDDLSSTDFTPFINCLSQAANPPWEARDNWVMFDMIADTFSRMAEKHLGKRKDIVATPPPHDGHGDIAQPFGEVRDWTKGECEPIPGKTMFDLTVVERDYPNLRKMYSALGPNVCREDGVSGYGVSWSCAKEYEILKNINGMVQEEGISKGMPRLTSLRNACEATLALSPETNGPVSVRSWQKEEKRTGKELADLSRPIEDNHITFQSVMRRPATTFTAPEWTGSLDHGRTYAAFTINIERRVPWHTLTGRQHFYVDHEWMRGLGEALPVYRPPLALADLGEVSGRELPLGRNALMLNLMSPHSKWSIHTNYSDNHIMRTLSRGGGEVWINDEDAASVGIRDNDWIECYNVNGVFMGRAVVTHRMPREKCYLHHGQERTVNVPMSAITGHRGGTDNSLTRTIIKPTQMIGAYGQLSYGFNYYGPSGCQRDEVILIRKAEKVVFNED